MARIVPLAISTRTDPYGVPVPGDVVDVDVDQIEHVEGVIVDNRWRALVDDCAPACHATLYATIAGTVHVIVIGQFDDLDDAITETDRFSVWLVGMSLLEVTEAQLQRLTDPSPDAESVQLGGVLRGRGDACCGVR